MRHGFFAKVMGLPVTSCHVLLRSHRECLQQLLTCNRACNGDAHKMKVNSRRAGRLQPLMKDLLLLNATTADLHEGVAAFDCQVLHEKCRQVGFTTRGVCIQ